MIIFAVEESITNEKDSDHANLALERDTVARGADGGPRPGSKMSWRNAPQNTVTLLFLSGVLLVFLGLLLGTTWTIQALQPKLRWQAEERRRLNEEWEAVRTARRHRGECPRCGSELSERNWYVAPTVVDDRPEDN